MKKNIITTILFIFYATTHAQEQRAEGISNTKTQFLMKLKIGYSSLDIDGLHKVNGNTNQLDILLSSRLKDQFRLEYGLGVSEFKGNHQILNTFTDIDNRYFRLPVNLIFSKEFNNNASITSGIGLYGTYLYKSKLFDEIEEKNLGIALGVNVLFGVRFPITSEIETLIQFEYQYDLNGIKSENTITEQKMKNTNLLAIGVVYKFND